MKNLFSRWIAAIMVGVMVASSGVAGSAKAEDNSIRITEEKFQGDAEDSDLKTGSDDDIRETETSQKEDMTATGENSVTETEIKKDISTNGNNANENFGNEEIVEESEVPEEIEMALNYLYINEAEQQVGEQQSIVLSWGNENTQVNNISLTLKNANGEQTILEATKKSDGLYLYEHIFSQGVYHVSNVHVATDESEKDFTAEELEIDAYFGVGKTPNESAKSSYIEMESVEEGEDSANTAASVETSVVSIGENGEETAEASIGAALEAQGVTARSGKARSARAKNVVVVLDPGHDSKHAGAYGNGVHEEVATLKIAQYCKEELEQYGGITVYMTRESAACPFPNSKDNIDDIKQRTAWAKTKGADVFVSFHLNSNDSSSPNGAEVYYPKTSSGGVALAQKIQGELVSLGLKNRGTKANETLAVINSSMKNGFPGVLIEHAFVSNSSDANNYLNSDAKLKKLGVADAKGIASYFKLSKGYWKEENGKRYYYINGQKATGEKYISGKWYYLNPEENGAMVTGIYKFSNKTVYYGSDGAMRYGEQLINGHWYYFDTVTGAMKTGFHKFSNKTVYYGSDGAMRYEEQLIDGQWYYFDTVTGAMKTGFHKMPSKTVYYGKDGTMQYGEQLINGYWYYFEPVTGKMKTGFYIFSNKTVYYGSDGAMRYGEQLINGHWYYFDTVTGAMTIGFHEFPNKMVYYDDDGKMHYGELILDGKKYYFDPITGAMKNKEGWIKEGDKTYYYESNEKVTGEKYISGKWYYFDTKKDGMMVTGMYKFPNKTVYYGSDGIMRYGEQLIDGHWYYFDMVTGAMTTGFHEFPNKMVYYDDDGKMHYGELTLDGEKYYFDPITGAMKNNKEGWIKEGDKTYYYESNEKVTGEKYISGKWYYFEPQKNGAMATGLYKLSNKTVYYGSDGTMQYGEQLIEDHWYYFDTVTGAMTTGIHKLPNKTVYYGSDGTMRYGEQLINGHWYCFDTVTGAMATGFYEFLNKTVYYDNDGKMHYGKLTLKDKHYYFDPVTGAMLINGMFDGQYYGPDGVQRDCYKILGKSNTSIDQMVRYYNKKSPIAYPSEQLGKGGAPDIRTMATIFYEEAAKENIKAEVVWTQTMKETGYFKFGGQVKIEQFNFAGIGAVDGGAAGASFPDVRTGVRAQIQHMKAYADASITKNTLSSACVDPRFDLVNPKGTAPYVEWLGQKENPGGYGWATGKEYGIDIVGMIQILMNS